MAPPQHPPANGDQDIGYVDFLSKAQGTRQAQEGKPEKKKKKIQHHNGAPARVPRVARIAAPKRVNTSERLFLSRVFRSPQEKGAATVVVVVFHTSRLEGAAWCMLCGMETRSRLGERELG